jgi:hypothetical protein
MTETEGRPRPKYLRLGEGSVGTSAPGGDNVPGWTLTVGELGALVRGEVAEALASRAAPPPALLDREALSIALGCSGSMVDKLRRGGMPHLRLGDSPRFELERCLEWLRQKEGAA